MTPNDGDDPKHLTHDERNSEMSRTLFSASALLLLTAVPATAPANDIVDFLRALNGVSARNYAPAPPIHAVGSRYDRYHTARHVDRYRSTYRTRRPVVVNRPGVSFHVGYNHQAPPPIPVAPAPVVHGYGAPALHHQIGDIITCPVPLETHVVVKDACEIAPNAIPIVVAVRDPHLGRFGSRGCVERLAYVEVLVPPCPLLKCRVSPCRTKVRLDYGRYEVDIVSRNGCIEIDYDD